MTTLHEDMQNYKNQLEKGAIQRAYRGLMAFMMGLRTRFQKMYPEHVVSGLYEGYMDMTYFAATPAALKERGLKIAIVFVHEAFRFEAWLAAVNKQVQAQYWQLFKESGWKQYPVVPTTQGADAILEHVLTEMPDFSNQEALSRQIEDGVLDFTRDIEAFLASHTI